MAHIVRKMAEIETATIWGNIPISSAWRYEDGGTVKASTEIT
jgi:hypothetical protein